MLNIEDNRVVPDPHTLIVPAFKHIWDNDKTKHKDKALKLFAYIYFKNDLKSDYRKSLSGKDLEVQIKKDLFEDEKYKIPKYVEKAEEIYVNLQMTKSMKLLLSAESAIEQITKYFNEFKVDSIKEKKDEIVTKVMNNLNKVDTLVNNVQLAKKRVSDELMSAKSNKRQLGEFEMPD